MPLNRRHIVLGAGAFAVRAVEATLSVPVRVIGPAAGAVANSSLAAPARRTASRALDGLATLGAREEGAARLRLENAGRALLRGPLVDQVMAALVQAGVIERIVDQLLDEGVVDRIVTRVLSSDDAERLVVVALESPGVEQAVVRVLNSDLVLATTDRVLESEELQRVVEHISNSPEVRNAIANQSLGLADVVAREVRTRSVTGDDTAERIARSFLRRRLRDDGGAPR